MYFTKTKNKVTTHTNTCVMITTQLKTIRTGAMVRSNRIVTYVCASAIISLTLIIIYTTSPIHHNILNNAIIQHMLYRLQMLHTSTIESIVLKKVPNPTRTVVAAFSVDADLLTSSIVKLTTLINICMQYS